MLQIASLLKDHERIQSVQSSAPSDDDSDIKKIKKVRHSRDVELLGRCGAVRGELGFELGILPLRWAEHPHGTHTELLPDGAASHPRGWQ